VSFTIAAMSFLSGNDLTRFQSSPVQVWNGIPAGEGTGPRRHRD
jgi:hypothetical protein